MNTNGNSYPIHARAKNLPLAPSSGLDSCETTGKAETPNNKMHRRQRTNKMAGHVLMSATLPD